MYTRQVALVNKYLVHLVMKTETISEGVYRITNIYSTEIYWIEGKSKCYHASFFQFVFVSSLWMINEAHSTADECSQTQ